MKVKIFERYRKPSPSPKISYRLHRAEFGHNVKTKKIPEYSYYPDTNNVIQFISKYSKIPKENISIGLGAESIIKDLFILLNQINKKRIFFLTPIFGMYQYYSNLFNFKIFSEELYPGNYYDIDKLKKKISNNNVNVLALVNPSHPIENYYDEKNLYKLIKFCESKNIFLIVDEVYNFKSIIPKKFLNYENVIFIRSFSKTFGLPGLRLGYGIANKKLIKFLENFRLAIEVGSNTTNFLNNTKKTKLIILKNQNKIKQALRYAKENFKKRKIAFFNSRVNSITFDCLTHNRREKIFKYLYNYKIYTLKLGGKKLDRFINITTTNIQNLKFFFKKIDEFNYNNRN